MNIFIFFKEHQFSAMKFAVFCILCEKEFFNG